MAVSRWAGRGWCGRGHGWSFGFRVPFADRRGGGCAVVAGPPAGSGHRGRTVDPGDGAGLVVVDSDPPQGRTRGRRIRADRSGHRRGLCGERSGEAGRGRGAALPCHTHRGRSRRGMSRSRGLVVPEQSRHPGRRVGGRSRRATAPSGHDHAAARRGRRAPARAGGGPLPPRCTRRRDARRRCGGGRAAGVHASCSAGGVTAGEAAAARSRPRGPRPRQRPGCPRPAAPGWNSRGL